MGQLTIRDKRQLLLTGVALRPFVAAAPALPIDDEDPAPDGPICRCCGVRECLVPTYERYEPLDDGGLCGECRRDVRAIASRYLLPEIEVIALWTAPRRCPSNPAEPSAFEEWIQAHYPAPREAIMA
jgi:hypothetical protein